MEAIKDVLPKAIETLELPTKANPRSTKVWAKFEQFQTLNDPQLEQMKDEAVSFMDDLFNARTPRWLSLLGTSGSGKTMLSKIIWHLFRDHRHTIIDWHRTRQTEGTNPRIIRWRGGFINWGKAVNRMLEGDYEFLEDVRDYDFFVLDDILSEYKKMRDLSTSKLYDVFESRLGKWTVITANASLSQVGELLDQRIASRMMRNFSSIVDVDVPDFNLRTA